MTTTRMTLLQTPRERGFSLVELMIALVVFAIGILTLAAVIPMGVRKTTAASQQTTASELGTMRAEQLLITPYDDADLNAGVHDDPANPTQGKYYVRWTVEDGQPVANCKRVTVSVHLNALTAAPTARVVVVRPQL
jgi:type IV pilus modification protein PilV